MEDNRNPEETTKVNRLKNEKSPYLLQHAKNPVEWYPWGEEAFKAARTEDKPIFLSIGYSTCHWCHVMAHESFEDRNVAEMMNRFFISIKVDREERPDIDNIYMTVCQMMTGSGGWPLTILMTPDKKPFFAGTYIPKSGSHGRIGLPELIAQVEKVWKTRRTYIISSAEQITENLRTITEEKAGDTLGPDILDKAYSQFENSYDSIKGGFGTAPKFPSPHNLMFLLRYWKKTGNAGALEMTEKTLIEMRKGGIFDQIGYGFHRYSTDSRWFLPHFEKMLYDQAMLALTYIEAYQATGKSEYERIVREIFDYVKRDMSDPEGGFYSAEDADSEGIEGKFYLLSTEDLRLALEDDEVEFFSRALNMSGSGNYAEEATGHKTGFNIPHLLKSCSQLAGEMNIEEDKLRGKIESARKKLFDYREYRIHPHKDDKILTDWNGLMIAALARGARVFHDPHFAELAENAADFVLTRMREPDGSLIHRYRDGQADGAGFIDDYAFMVWGLIELYQATFEIGYLRKAIKLNRYLLDHFWDDKNGGFFFTADNSEELLSRRKEIYDGAIPSGNSVAAMNLLKLARITADSGLEKKASEIFKIFSGRVEEYPAGYAMLLCALDFALGPSYEIVIAGDLNRRNTREMLAALISEFVPNHVLLFRPGQEEKPEISEIAGYTQNQRSLDGNPIAYVCRNFACSLPTTDIGEMMKLLKK